VLFRSPDLATGYWPIGPYDFTSPAAQLFLKAWLHETPAVSMPWPSGESSALTTAPSAIAGKPVRNSHGTIATKGVYYGAIPLLRTPDAKSLAGRTEMAQEEKSEIGTTAEKGQSGDRIGRSTKDIETEGTSIPKWDAAEPEKSLTGIHSYVIGEASKSVDWYWRAKRSKARPSQAIRFLAWILAAIGGLLPVIGYLFQSHIPANLRDGLWASLLLGVAAALLGLDKAFGYSSGWARYVLTATNIRKALEEFRLDWAELMAKAGTSLTGENAALLIERAKKFRVDVESLVLEETKDWVTEFQSSMAQMEKDVGAQLSALKTQVDKSIQTREAASQPGLIEITVTNADKADAGKVQLRLEGPTKITAELEPGSKSFAKENIPCGQYRVVISAKVGNKDVSTETPVVIKAGETLKTQLSLPI